MSQSRFVWYELMTTDRAGAEAFYSKVVGWRPAASDIGADYTLLMIGETRAAGLMTLPQEALDNGARPAWIGYVGVDDVDAKTAEVVAKGGIVHRQPADLPVGRFSIVADPTGGAFVLFKPSGIRDRQPELPARTPGTIGWHELYAGDGPAAFAWYADLFGWEAGETMDMGPMGKYQLFRIGGEDAGAVMTKPPQAPRPYWNYYIFVDAIGAAAERVKAAGGQVIMGPMDVPGGGKVLQALDPQGAVFSLLAYS